MNKCSFCNYSTYSNYNYNRHIKSKSHYRKEEEHLRSKKQKLYKCICGKEYESRTGLYLHTKKYQCKDNDNSDKEITKKNNNSYDLEELTKIINKTSTNSKAPIIYQININNNSNNNSNNNTNTKIKNMQLLNQATTLYPNAPILKKLDNYNNLDNENSDEFIGYIIYHFNRYSLEKYFGDFLLKYYKKKDISEQSIFNTDVPRLNFIIKILIKNESIWRKDWQGLNTQKTIIRPMLKETYDTITEYIKRENRNKNIDYLCSNLGDQARERFSILANVQKMIESKKLEKAILKYVAPYFKINNLIGEDDSQNNDLSEDCNKSETFDDYSNNESKLEYDHDSNSDPEDELINIDEIYKQIKNNSGGIISKRNLKKLVNQY